MAGEIQITGLTSGWNVYAVVTTAAGLLTDGSGGTAAYSAANWNTYDIPLAEAAAGSGKYVGDFPLNLNPAEAFGVEVRRRTGGSPNISVAVDPYLGGGTIGTQNANVTGWSGNAVQAPNVPGVPIVDIYAYNGNDLTAFQLMQFAQDYTDQLLNCSLNGSVNGIGAGGITLTSFAPAAIDATVAPFLDAAVSTRATPAQVNAQVLDVLNVDTFAEPTGVPAATATLATKVGRLYQALVSPDDVTANAKTFYSFAGVAQWKKTLADDGTTYSETAAASP